MFDMLNPRFETGEAIIIARGGFDQLADHNGFPESLLPFASTAAHNSRFLASMNELLGARLAIWRLRSERASQSCRQSPPLPQAST
jgi:hypothetical protein